MLRMDTGAAIILEQLRQLSCRLLASPASNSALRELGRAVEALSPLRLGLRLPSPAVLSSAHSPVVYAGLADASSMHASVFGFTRANEVIPMHDHPRMHGFIRVLRGSLRVTSFSRVPASTRLRYEGIKEVSARDGCIVLSPASCNIHEIRALEAGSFFFDLLVPGYREVDCTYYSMPYPLPRVGEECELERCTTPTSYHCVQMYYPMIHFED